MNDYEIYVSLELAMMLKEAGFDWEIKTFYYMGELGETMLGEAKNHNFSNDFVSAPTLAVAQKWMREVMGVNVEVMYLFKPCNYYFARACHLEDDSVLRIKDCQSFVYERALEAGIIAALKEEMWLRKQKQEEK